MDSIAPISLCQFRGPVSELCFRAQVTRSNFGTCLTKIRIMTTCFIGSEERAFLALALLICIWKRVGSLFCHELYSAIRASVPCVLKPVSEGNECFRTCAGALFGGPCVDIYGEHCVCSVRLRVSSIHSRRLASLPSQSHQKTYVGNRSVKNPNK